MKTQLSTIERFGLALIIVYIFVAAFYLFAYKPLVNIECIPGTLNDLCGLRTTVYFVLISLVAIAISSLGLIISIVVKLRRREQFKTSEKIFTAVIGIAILFVIYVAILTISQNH